MARRKIQDDDEQTEIPGTEQEKIVEIERWARKYKKQGVLIKGLKGERDNFGLKFDEAMLANADKLQKDGDDLVYVRGDVKARYNTKHTREIEIEGAEEAE